MKILRIIVPIFFFAMSALFLVMLGPMSGVVTFKDNFQKGISSAWQPKTPEKWALASADKNSFYQLKEPGEHDDKIGRPTEYSLVKDLVYTDFTFTCKLRCDAPVELRYRDMVIIFGYQDDTHFYYVHLSNISDDLHNAIMLVNGNYRRKINKELPEPTLTDLEFHKVRVNWNGAIGQIKVYFDGKPVMEAQDDTFKGGKVGIGSLDDVGAFDNVHIRGKLAEETL